MPLFLLLFIVVFSLACGGSGGGGNSAALSSPDGLSLSISDNGTIEPIVFDDVWDLYLATSANSYDAFSPVNGVVDSPYDTVRQSQYSYVAGSYANRGFDYGLISDAVNEAWFSFFYEVVDQAEVVGGRIYYPSGNEYYALINSQREFQTAGTAFFEYDYALINSHTSTLARVIAVTFHELMHIRYPELRVADISPEYAAMYAQVMLMMELYLLDPVGREEIAAEMQNELHYFIQNSAGDVYRDGVGLLMYSMSFSDVKNHFYSLQYLDGVEATLLYLQSLDVQGRGQLVIDAFYSYASYRDQFPDGGDIATGDIIRQFTEDYVLDVVF